MNPTKMKFWVVCLGMLGSFAFANDFESEATKAGQSLADALREVARADLAFFPAAAMRKSASIDLTGHLLYPTDEVSVVSLKGTQVRAALERSIAVFPLPNSAFLQLSGLEARFSRSAAPDKRVTNVVVSDAPLEDSRTYTVAMPSTLARGSLGYFRVWEREAILRTLDGQSLEDLLKGRKVEDSAPRWRSQ